MIIHTFSFSTVYQFVKLFMLVNILFNVLSWSIPILHNVIAYDETRVLFESTNVSIGLILLTVYNVYPCSQTPMQCFVRSLKYCYVAPGFRPVELVGLGCCSNIQEPKKIHNYYQQWLLYSRDRNKIIFSIFTRATLGHNLLLGS